MCSGKNKNTIGPALHPAISTLSNRDSRGGSVLESFLQLHHHRVPAPPFSLFRSSLKTPLFQIGPTSRRRRRPSDYSPPSPDFTCGEVPLSPHDCLWSIQRQTTLSRLFRPSRSSLIKISAFGRHSTSSTLVHHLLLLKSPKTQFESLLLDSSYIHGPEFNPNHQLPHRTSSEVLPLTEEESRSPRQITSGSVCFRYRPP